jgi:hypothetical protein
MFADNTSLFLWDEPTNLEKAMHTLSRYCEASSAKTNWHKTVAIWPSRQDRTWD